MHTYIMTMFGGVSINTEGNQGETKGWHLKLWRFDHQLPIKYTKVFLLKFFYYIVLE